MESECQCDLGMSPSPLSRILAGMCDGRQGALCVRLWVWSLREEGLSEEPGEGQRSGRVGVWAVPVLQLLHSPPNPEEAFKPSHGRDQLSECPPSAIRKEGLSEAFKSQSSDLSPRPGHSERLVMAAFFPAGHEDKSQQLEMREKTSKCTHLGGSIF